MFGLFSLDNSCFSPSCHTNALVVDNDLYMRCVSTFQKICFNVEVSQQPCVCCESGADACDWGARLGSSARPTAPSAGITVNRLCWWICVCVCVRMHVRYMYGGAGGFMYVCMDCGYNNNSNERKIELLVKEDRIVMTAGIFTNHHYSLSEKFFFLINGKINVETLFRFFISRTCVDLRTLPNKLYREGQFATLLDTFEVTHSVWLSFWFIAIAIFISCSSTQCSRPREGHRELFAFFFCSRFPVIAKPYAQKVYGFLRLQTHNFFAEKVS